DHLAPRFRDPTADRITPFFSLGKVHVRAILFEVVQSAVVVFLRTLQTVSAFLLSSAGDQFCHSVLLVTQRMTLLLGPLVGALASGAKERCGELRYVFASMKEFHAPTPLQTPL